MAFGWRRKKPPPSKFGYNQYRRLRTISKFVLHCVAGVVHSGNTFLIRSPLLLLPGGGGEMCSCYCTYSHPGCGDLSLALSAAWETKKAGDVEM